MATNDVVQSPCSNAAPTEANTVYTDVVRELVAIGAAIAANCEPCFKFHYDKARKLGVSNEDMAKAVDTGVMVKEASASNIVNLANRHLGRAQKEQPSSATKSACCS